MRIVQISDVHVGVLVREKRLAAILRKVKEAQPDLLVSTGTSWTASSTVWPRP